MTVPIEYLISVGFLSQKREKIVLSINIISFCDVIIIRSIFNIYDNLIVPNNIIF